MTRPGGGGDCPVPNGAPQLLSHARLELAVPLVEQGGGKLQGTDPDRGSHRMGAPGSRGLSFPAASLLPSDAWVYVAVDILIDS